MCEHLGIKGKTRVEPKIWEQFKYDALKGKKDALKQITEHCVYDVITLEQAWEICFKYDVVSISLR